MKSFDDGACKRSISLMLPATSSIHLKILTRQHDVRFTISSKRKHCVCWRHEFTNTVAPRFM